MTNSVAAADADFLRYFSGAQRVLVIESEPATPHLQTGMQIADRLCEQGIETHYASLEFPLFTFGRTPWPVTFEGQRHELMLHPDVQFHRSTLKMRQLRDTAQGLPRSLPEIREFVAESSNLGLGALSSASGRLNRLDFATDSEIQIVRLFLALAKHSYEMTREVASSLDADTIVVFNGRFAASYGQRQAAKAIEVPFVTHERGGSDDRFDLWVNTTPHDMDALRQKFIDHASGFAGAVDRRELTEQFRSRGFSPTSGVSDGWSDLGRGDVVYFSSSFAEYAWTEHRYFTPWATEQEAVMALASTCEKLGRRLLLRLHPNMVQYGRDELRLWDPVIHSGRPIEVVLPRDRVNSYSLVENALLVVTGFSTIGLEAALRGRPVAVMADAPYVPAIGDVRIRSSEELYEVVREPDLARTDSESAAMFAFFLTQHGLLHTHFCPEGPHHGTYRGKTLDKTREVLGRGILRRTRATRWSGAP